MPKILSSGLVPRRPGGIVRYGILALFIILVLYTINHSSSASRSRPIPPVEIDINGDPVDQPFFPPPTRQPEQMAIPDKESTSHVIPEVPVGGKSSNKETGKTKKPDKLTDIHDAKADLKEDAKLKQPQDSTKPTEPKRPSILDEIVTEADDSSPIDRLIFDAQNQFAGLLSKETNTLSEAAQAYRKRRGRHPPPGFDKWFQFAKSTKAIVVEEFWDQIYHDLGPFWGMNPALIRKESWDYEMTINIRNGTATAGSDWFWTTIWLDMIKSIEHLLPDMDLALNAMDEPRLVVPWEDIDDYMQTASKTRQLLEPKKMFSEFQVLPAPGKGDPEVATRTKHWEDIRPYWKVVQRGCPPDSLARVAPRQSTWSEPPVIDMSNAEPHMYKGFVSNFSKSSELCHQPDLQGLEGILISPLSVSATKTLFPMFGGSKLQVNNEILLPEPMYWNEEERFTGGNDHGVEWSAKGDGAIWRGVATGGKNTADNWKGFQRHRFVAMNNATKLSLSETGTMEPPNFALPETSYGLKAQKAGKLGDWVDEWADVAFVDLMCEPPEPDARCSYTNEEFDIVPGLTMLEQFKYKYLPDIDGNSFSGRYLGFLRSTSLPIKATLWREWLDSRLVPWKHFVPMDSRFGDWYSIMEYFLGFNGKGAHDAAAEKIATEGKVWAEQVLRKEDMQIYTLRLLLEYARVLDDGRERLGWVDDVIEDPTLQDIWSEWW